CNNVVLIRVAAHNLNIDGRREPEIQNLAHNVGWLEEELNSRKTLRELFAKSLHVLFGGPVFFLIQGHQNLRVRSPNAAARAVGVVDRAIRQSNVVQDRNQLLSGDLLPQHILHFIAKARGFFNPQSGTSSYVKAEYAGIHRREEVLPEKENQTDGCDA